MNLLFRLAWTWLARLWRPQVPPFGPCVTPFRVWPTDLDLYLHVNNGVYLSLLDVARVDLMYRARLMGQVRARGWYPVVAAETIRFRKSLQPFDRFRVVTRVIGWDEKALLMGQDFVRGDEVVASAVIRSRFLSKDGGSVAPADLATLTGVSPESPPLPDWVERWNDAQRQSGAAGVAQVS
ncbi:MAG: thioesterase family protein [Gemmatimonadota bacterium]|nr:thioesterase family protein [Gemmatimonadota bacterium]